MINKKTNQSCD